MIEVRPTTIQEVSTFRKLAAADGINLKPNQTMAVMWFGAYAGEHLIGFGALGSMEGQRWRLRGLWVSPMERGQGASHALNVARVRHLIDTGATGTVSLYQRAELPEGYYEREFGFHDTGKRHPGSGARYLEADCSDLRVAPA